MGIHMRKLTRYCNPQFDEAGPFSDGLALVTVEGRIGYANKVGKYVWNPVK
jgi:hypothetical protein